jgi:hypothetical protein
VKKPWWFVHNGIGKRAEAVLGSFVDEARVDGGGKGVGAIGKEIPNFGGAFGRPNFAPSPKQKSHSANSKPLADGTISRLLTIFLKDKSVNSS